MTEHFYNEPLMEIKCKAWIVSDTSIKWLTKGIITDTFTFSSSVSGVALERFFKRQWRLFLSSRRASLKENNYERVFGLIIHCYPWPLTLSCRRQAYISTCQAVQITLKATLNFQRQLSTEPWLNKRQLLRVIEMCFTFGGRAVLRRKMTPGQLKEDAGKGQTLPTVRSSVT